MTNTNDSGPGSLRQAILNADANSSGPSDILFDIPASTSPLLNIPVPGFDPDTQTWTITLDSPLPAITSQVIIDGYSQAHFAVPFRYPSVISSAIQEIDVTGSRGHLHAHHGGTASGRDDGPDRVQRLAGHDRGRPGCDSRPGERVRQQHGGTGWAGGLHYLHRSVCKPGDSGSHHQRRRPDRSAHQRARSHGDRRRCRDRRPHGITSTPNSVSALNGNNAQQRIIVNGMIRVVGPGS